MGRDGAAGLLALRRVGAVTIGQDESSSAVWGMPGAAVALGAVGSELPLSRIAAEIADSVARLVVSEAV
jgi:two-component system chemotaxis response regulator CheB